MSTGDQTRTKFSVGYYLTEKEDSPTCFSELARRFAPRLKEVYFPWPGLANGRASAGLCAADCTHCGKCADTLKRVLKPAPAQPA